VEAVTNGMITKKTWDGARINEGVPYVKIIVQGEKLILFFRIKLHREKNIVSRKGKKKGRAQGSLQ
jgi:hypothetical protein